MPSHSILPEARRAAITAAFDEALAEVRAAGDVALLQECRAIFRQRVPLNLRAYVAAALVLKHTGSGRPAPHKADRSGVRSGDRSGDHQNEATKDRGGKKPPRDVAPEGRPEARGRNAASSPRPERVPRAEEAAVQSDGREEREVREVREVRENRYRGEGVTLFVSAGRRQRFYARIAIKLLLEIPGVGDASIGDIRTMDNYSFIVVDPAVEETVIAALNGYDFKGRTLAVNRARKKGETEPLSNTSDASDGVDGGDAGDSGLHDEVDLDPDEEGGATEDV